METSVLPSPSKSALVGIKPAWNMVNMLPRTWTVPVRDPPEFASTATITIKWPSGSTLDTGLSHGKSEKAFQRQPGAVFTVNWTLPPLAGTFACVGERVNVQPSTWATSTVWPPTNISPDRLGPLFGRTEKVKLPAPEPEPL